MHALLVCSGCCDFVWCIFLILSMVAGIDGGEGSSVGAWRKFISWVQVQVLFERISRGGATRWKEHLAGKIRNVVRCTKCPPDIWNYFLHELQRVQERKKAIHDERLH
jgi:hypothetical protein